MGRDEIIEAILLDDLRNQYINVGKLEDQEMAEKTDWQKGIENQLRLHDQFFKDYREEQLKLITHLFGLDWKNGKIGQLLKEASEQRKLLEDYMKLGTETHHMLEKRISECENKIKTINVVSETKESLKAKIVLRVTGAVAAIGSLMTIIYTAIRIIGKMG